MAINKLNLNGTVYDIGEAEGTNTAESIVEFDSADEENPSSADESVALIKSGDTHKSLWEKMSAGMKNIRYLLKQVTSLNSALADLQTATQDSGWIAFTLESGVSSGSYGRSTPSYKKIGNQVFIEAGISFSYSGSSVQVSTIPSGYRPVGNHYFFCACSGSYVARCFVTAAGGGLYVEWIRAVSDGSQYSGTMSWLDFSTSYFVD